MKQLSVLALVFASAAVFAQTAKPMGLSARAGFFFPTAQRAKQAGKTWFGFGVDYKLGDLKFASETGQAASYGISVDFTSKNDFRQTPIVGYYRASLQDNIYYVVGAGLNFTQELSGGSTPSRDNKTGIAYQVGLGMDLKGQSLPLFIEAKYMGSSRSKLNGLGFFGGIRF
ncbi:MAG: outer membrane beta-barrel protein [Chthonomonas sp.]|nr:outer membrane beta-barrel protein [Chthonomonas sp.]